MLVKKKRKKNPQDETREGVRIFLDVRKTLHSLLVL
jgi:hypothetical protein